MKCREVVVGVVAAVVVVVAAVVGVVVVVAADVVVFVVVVGRKGFDFNSNLNGFSFVGRQLDGISRKGFQHLD